jgi:hypothetical protein
MAGHRHLDVGRENAHADVGAGALGRQDERALGEVHLAGDPLHAIGIQTPRIGEHRQLVAEQRFACEYVVLEIRKAHAESSGGSRD